LRSKVSPSFTPGHNNAPARWAGIQQVAGKQSRNRPLANDVRPLARAIIGMCGYRAYSCLE